MKKKKKKYISNFISEKKEVFQNNKILLGFVWKFAPEMVIFKIIAIIMILVSDITFNVLFVKYIIDGMGKAISYYTVLWYIAGLALVRVLCDGANAFYNQFIEPIGQQKVHKGVYNMIYEKVVSVDIEKFDDTSFYNDYIWALNQIDGKTMNSFTICVYFLRNILNVLVYSFVSILYDKWILVFVIIPVILNVMLGNQKAKVNYKLVKELNPVNRKKDYSRRAFYLNQYAKEIKTYQVGDILVDNFNECVDQNISIVKKFRSRLFGLVYFQNHVSWLFAKILSTVYMSYRVLVMHSYSVGVFVVIFQAVGTFTSSMISLFSVIPKLQENGLFARKILKILNYESKIEAYKSEKRLPDVVENIQINNVSFQYPHSEKPVLENINLTLKKGEKIALVGANGAGKTTLIKLLLRLYDPMEGKVLLNGQDIRKYTTKEYRKKFSTIFQDYQIYALRLIENIFMRHTKEDDIKKAKEYLEKSRLSEYKNNLEDYMTKEFDKNGLIFSGGQSQKLAIARAMAKNGEIMIMDEASSALDPISEDEINRTILESASNKSMIIISHRLSTIQYVDRIYFMDNGKIIEEGTHDELMSIKGKYAEMYEIQAEKYQK